MRYAEIKLVDTGDLARVPVLDVAEVVALERTIACEGTSLLELMTRAGNAIARAVEMRVPAGASVVVLAGTGNNGGDGWVAARALASAEYDVTLVSKVGADMITVEPARTAAMEADDANGFEVVVNPGENELAWHLTRADVIVDAILGTGFAHDSVREPYATWIRRANAMHDEGAFVVSADCPSGLNAQAGVAADDCIVADQTVTMIVPKRGLLESEAIPYVGTLMLAPLVTKLPECFPYGLGDSL